MLIGLTGQIGSGKSSIARILFDYRVTVIDADRVGHELLDDPQIRTSLVTTFGSTILDPSGAIDRPMLGKLALASKASTDALNQIVWPPLTARIVRQIRKIGQMRDIIVDAAVLPDWPMIHKRCDIIVLVTAPEEMRLRRLQAKGVSTEVAQAIMGRQRPIEDYRRLARITIDNSGSVDHLIDTAHRLAEQLGLWRH